MIDNIYVRSVFISVACLAISFILSFLIHVIYRDNFALVLMVSELIFSAMALFSLMRVNFAQAVTVTAINFLFLVAMFWLNHTKILNI